MEPPATQEDPIESSRRYALAEIQRLLGIMNPTVNQLLDRARPTIGDRRTDRCLELARLAPLTRRCSATSAIAALVVATQYLGVDWWTRPHSVLTQDSRWEERETPDALLAAGQCSDMSCWPGLRSCLNQLAHWAADAAADKQWGRPFAYVDLDYRRPVVLPPNAHVGDRLLAAWDIGCRVWVNVVRLRAYEGYLTDKGLTPDALIGSEFEEPLYHDVEEIDCFWATATDIGPIRLPGEVPGESTDPFAAPIDQQVGQRLLQWALAHGATDAEIGQPWITKADLWSARFRLSPQRRPAPWPPLDRAIQAVVDGDSDELAVAFKFLTD